MTEKEKLTDMVAVNLQVSPDCRKESKTKHKWLLFKLEEAALCCVLFEDVNFMLT